MKMHNYMVKENLEFKDQNTASHYLLFQEGPLEGVAFTFGKIEFLGEDEEGNGKINFDYHLLLVPENINLEERKEEIENNIGDVLRVLLEENLTQDNNNETGNDDSVQSIEGRDVLEEGDSLSEG
jgi:hypothetical protein